VQQSLMLFKGRLLFNRWGLLFDFFLGCFEIHPDPDVSVHALTFTFMVETS